MLFNLFGKKKAPLPGFMDVVFMSPQAKTNAVIAFAKQHNDFIFIAWFENTALQFRQLFVQHGLDENSVEEAKYYTAGKYTGRQIAFLEHYPLSAKEEKLVQNSSQQSFTVYNSLTEPLLQYFGGERVITVMQKMGYGEDEPVQHSMISKSIRNAQKKIARKVTLEQPAGSPEDWMRRNVGSNKSSTW